jgi:hypothetical protein
MIEKRVHYRRYEDRRMAMMLAVYERLFEEAPGMGREQKILEAIVTNFRIDRAAFVDVRRFEKEGLCDLAVRVGHWLSDAPVISVEGKGLKRLLSLHEIVDGALSFESVRKPEAFDKGSWDSLWREGIGGSAKALLSIQMPPRAGAPRLMWLQQVRSSREWSSRDRDLAEEVVSLLTRAEDKGV